MAELGSTGGNLDNILQYLLQRIEKSGIAVGGTGGGGGDVDLSDYVKKGDVRTFSIFNSDGTSLLYEFKPLGESNQEMRILTADDLKDYVQADDVKTMTWSYYDAEGNKQWYKYNPLGETNGELDFAAGLVSSATYNEHVEKYNTFVEKFDSMFELTEDGKIKAKMSFYSTGDISAYGDADSQIPSAEVSVIPKYEDGILIATINGTEIYAPEGGGTADLEDYAKIQWVNDNFLTEPELETWIGGKGYATDEIAQEHADTALAEAKSYANGKFVTKADDYEEISGIKQLNGTYTYFKTLYIEPNSSLGGAFVGWQDGTPAILIREDGRIAYYKGIQGYIELYGEPPFIDFHYGNSTTDFTSRIIESSSGVLELLSRSQEPGTLKIGNAYITYDSENNALMVSNGSGGAVNLVAMGDVAAFGGLGSGFDTLTDLTLTNKLTVKDVQASNKITSASIEVKYLSVSNSMQQNIDMGGYDIDNCQNATCQYMYTGEINLVSDQITELSASGSYVFITINGARYRISATKV